MKQTTFASAAWVKKGKLTRRERFLAEMDQVIPWASILALIEPHYPKEAAFWKAVSAALTPG
jgi:IS5 family transposase